MLPKHFIEQSEVDENIRVRTWKELEREAERKKLILFGAGEGARKFMVEYALIGKFKPAYIVDNAEEKWGQVMNGLSINTPNILKEEEPDKTVIVIASVYIKSISRQLQQMGFANLFSFLYLRYVDRTIRLEEQKMIEQLKELLADEKSKQILERIVNHRNRNDWDYRDCYEPEQYFVKELMIPKEHEVFVDAGAYNGDTIQSFLTWCQNCFRSIYAYEPDEENYRKLYDIYRDDERIHCFQACLWRENTQLTFESNHDSTSIVAEEGNGVVQAKKLEVSDKVTLLKMDIEGAELEALEGAKEIILRDRPRLTICIYHKYDDLWKIPFWIHNLCPNYQLYIRHHSMQWHETVVYAI